MTDFNKIMRLSKKIADAVIKGERMDKQDWDGLFDKNFRNKIYNRLTDFEALEEREELRSDFENLKEDVWAEFGKQLNPVKKLNFPLFIAKIAAVFVGIIGIGLLYTLKLNENTEETIIDGNAITLIMDDGTVTTIDTDYEEKLVNASGQIVGVQMKGTLNYMNLPLSEELAYNEIKVPYGKKIKLRLSDGTHVQLNAGTSMRYPIKFIKDNERQVFLEGEAYFTVTKDTIHSFNVIMGEMGVKVLGTQFNVSSYPGEPDIKTVLVEGSVALSGKDKSNETLLKPGHLATWDKSAKAFSIIEADVEQYTAWTKGTLIFRGMLFENMIKQLERAYNVSINCTNQELKNEIFSANFDVDIESIEQVLDYIKLQHPFIYTIENQQININ